MKFIALLCSLLCFSCLSEATSLAQKGAEFLAINATRDTVNVTATGLQYSILKSGNESRAGKRDKVKVHYQGKHVNGEVFNSNYGGKAFQTKLSRVIDGWTEGLQLIGEGGRIVLYIPPDLAYGRRGSPPVIQRNETLIFIIDLVEIIAKK